MSATSPPASNGSVTAPTERLRGEQSPGNPTTSETQFGPAKRLSVPQATCAVCGQPFTDNRREAHVAMTLHQPHAQESA